MIQSKKINVLVVDDSKFMQKLIAQVLNSAPDIEVIGTAGDGNEAIEQTQILHPDVITMDVRMPRRDGISALKEIMSFCPTPTIMVSSYTTKGAEETIDALRVGAIDFVTKPSQRGIALDLEKITEELIKKVKMASRIKAIRSAHHISPQPNPDIVEEPPTAAPMPSESGLRKSEFSEIPTIPEDSVVVIASSTGGPQALNDIIPLIPKNFAAGIIIVQHMPQKFTNVLAKQLNRRASILVKEAENGEKIKSGIAFIAPGDYHLHLTSNGKISLLKTPKIHGHRPSADVTMRSVAEIYEGNAVGIVLTGMGSDGKFGVKAIKAHGGKTIAQNEETSILFGMPGEAIATGEIDWILPVHKISDFLIKLVGVKENE